MDQPLSAVMDLPDPSRPGAWSERYAERLQVAERLKSRCDSAEVLINSVKSAAVRNRYRLEVYEQVNRMVRFTPEILLTLKSYDQATGNAAKGEALDRIGQLEGEFSGLRTALEQVYSETRILEKPEDYILDQDHHTHLANQTRSFDWQFTAELLFLEKIKNTYFK